MLRLCNVETLLRRVEVGRTQPFFAEVSSPENEYFDVVLKLSQGTELGVESLANEYLGVVLAADLGLPVCEGFFVNISEDFINSIPDLNIKDRIVKSSRLAFGSRHVGNQWNVWNETASKREYNLQTILGVFVFDALTGNPDRIVRNPNLLIKGNDIRLIDHELCFFALRALMFPKFEPWKLGNTSPMINFGAESEHIFSRFLKSKKELNFYDIRARWMSISSIRMEEYIANLPVLWRDCEVEFSNSVTQLGVVIERIDDCLAEVERVLS